MCRNESTLFKQIMKHLGCQHKLFRFMLNTCKYEICGNECNIHSYLKQHTLNEHEAFMPKS